MNSTSTQMAAQIPSGFGMPACGHAFDAISGRIATSGSLTSGAVVRDREAVLALGYTKSFPWTSAWRPPTS